MRLTRSLALWLAATTALVLSGHGWIQLRQEREDLTHVARREVALLTTAVRSSVENALRDRQSPDIAELLRQLEVKDPAVDIFVFDRDDRLIAGSGEGGAAAARARAIADSSPAPRELAVDELPAVGMVGRAALRIDGSVIGQLVLVRPTDALRADLAAEREATVLSIAGLILALSGVSWLVVRYRVLKPLSQIVAGIRRIASGDLSGRMAMTGRDEISEIAKEVDAMAGALGEARRRLAAEADRLEQLELDMQRANKLATVGELAAMLAHEIGSPLQVLNGRARALVAREDLQPDARRIAVVLVEQTERIDRIVQRLLGVARRKSGQVDHIDPSEPLALVAELLAVEARRRGVGVELQLGHDIPRITANADHFQQVMLNLMQNALRACSRGQVVRIAMSRASFTRPASPAPIPSVAIAVEDGGKGVPEELRASIFEPFWSGWDDGAGSRGTGLGLSVVKSIMSEHGGVVTVGSARAGGGACFTVHFPLIADDAAGVKEAS